MPYPIQLGSISERIRKFFRLRGKTSFSLDEIIVPVTMIQDLTKGPYQAGVTPCAGEERVFQAAAATTGFTIAVMLNDKVGSITPVLPAQFDDRSFSITWMEAINVATVVDPINDLRIGLQDRATFVAQTPTGSQQLVSIQNNPGNIVVPVELFSFDDLSIPANQTIIRTSLGNNTNTLGVTRQFEPTPHITIGPKDVMVVWSPSTNTARNFQLNIRGFYQEQPA